MEEYLACLCSLSRCVFDCTRGENKSMDGLRLRSGRDDLDEVTDPFRSRAVRRLWVNGDLVADLEPSITAHCAGSSMTGWNVPMVGKATAGVAEPGVRGTVGAAAAVGALVLLELVESAGVSGSSGSDVSVTIIEGPRGSTGDGMSCIPI